MYLQAFVVHVYISVTVLEVMMELCVCCYSYNLNVLLQQQQQKLSEPYEQSAAYLRYTQEATEVIKNAVGVCYCFYMLCIFVFFFSWVYSWYL